MENPGLLSTGQKMKVGVLLLLLVMLGTFGVGAYYTNKAYMQADVGTSSGNGAGTNDTTAPSSPAMTKLETDKCANQANIAWKQVADDSGIAKYVLYRNNEQIAEVDPSLTSWTDLFLRDRKLGTTYFYGVKAVDGKNNESSIGGKTADLNIAGCQEKAANQFKDIKIQESNGEYNLSWTTSLPSIGQVAHGASATLNKMTEGDVAYNQKHQVTIELSQPLTTEQYYFKLAAYTNTDEAAVNNIKVNYSHILKFDKNGKISEVNQSELISSSFSIIKASGIIKDQANGEAISQAEISLIYDGKVEQTALSQANGNYEITLDGAKSGNYILEVKKDGYATGIEEIEGTGQEFSLNFNLKHKSYLEDWFNIKKR